MLPSDWKPIVGEAIKVRAAMQQADTRGIFPYRLPRVRATAEAVAEAESALKCKIDAHYRSFLECADGWPSFYQAVDLFGTAELRGGGLAARARELVSYLEDNVLEDLGMRPSDFYPIGVSESDITLFVMVRRAV